MKPEEIREMPWPVKADTCIWPVFLPFLGCPAHCVFCGQEAQTGVRRPASLEALEAVLQQHGAGLTQRLQEGSRPPQLAFYGGTFTAMDGECLHLCLRWAALWRQAGLISGFRCSTRPDCISPEIIASLKNAGCRLVELGIQSFAPRALAGSERGYTPQQALTALAMLREAGLGPGVQLLPGMPGSLPGDFLADVCLAIREGASCLRFYPCVVLDGTGLAALWRRGAYEPWPLARALDELAEAWLMAAMAQIPVIRMGLAAQPGMKILAGPWHEALGARVMGRALALFAARRKNSGPLSVYAPRSVQGCFWGWRQELAGFWRRQRLLRVQFWQRDYVRLECFSVHNH